MFGTVAVERTLIETEMTANTGERRLLAVSVALFSRQGLTAPGIKQILDAADARLSSLSHYFPSGKDELAAEAIETAGLLFQLHVEAEWDQADDLPTAMPPSSAAPPRQSGAWIRPSLTGTKERVSPHEINLRSIVLDCPDPRALAAFYAAMLGGQSVLSDPAWCEVHVEGREFKLAFQLAEPYIPPSWPSGTPQQLHLDLTVDDLNAASARAVDLGAVVLSGTLEEPGCSWIVHADPAGHPFCLCRQQASS